MSPIETSSLPSEKVIEVKFLHNEKACSRMTFTVDGTVTSESHGAKRKASSPISVTGLELNVSGILATFKFSFTAEVKVYPSALDE